MRQFADGDASVHNAVPHRVVFGAGSAATVAAEVGRLGASRPLVVATPGHAAMARAVADRLESGCAGVLATAIPQVPIELARAAQQQARTVEADCLVSVGGGAARDCREIGGASAWCMDQAVVLRCGVT